MSDGTNSAPANVNPGDKIAGYRLEEQIGQGGMAVVYRALDERLDRRVALKLLAPGLAADTAFRTRFIRESRAAAAVDHPNIIPVYDAGDAGGFLFIAMRYVQGGDVRSLFASGQVLSPARVWNIISQVAAALDAAHEHDLIHRDVKPANMLLDSSSRNTGGKRGQVGDETDHVYLSDFGISKQTLASHLTSTGQFVGTLDYIAPEQIEGKAIDGSVDQYSLACATYELLTGEPPYRRDLGLALINAHLSAPPPSVVSRRPELPPAVDQVLAKAMSKSPAARYASCVEFATDLGKAIGMVAGTPIAVAAVAPTSGGPAVGVESAPKPYQATELASPITAADAAAGPAAGQGTPATNQAGQLVPPAAAAAGAVAAGAVAGAITPPTPQWPAGAPGGFDVATQYAAQPGLGQPGLGQPGQTPPPQQQPPAGAWQTGQPGYGQYPQQQYPPQPYQTGPIGPPVGGPAATAWQPPYQGAGPSGPGWQQPAAPRKSRGVVIGAVLATLIVAIAAVAVVYFVVVPKKHTNANGGGSSHHSSSVTTPPSSPSSQSSSSQSTTPATQTASSQASAMSNLLSTSANSRLQWNSNTLVNDVANCGDLSYDISQIKDIANERSNELNQADALQTGALPNGSTLKSELMNALQISLQIDNDYLHWAQQQQSSGCSVGTNSSYYSEATSEDNTATDDKTTFVDNWNPVASEYGLQQFSAGQI